MAPQLYNCIVGEMQCDELTACLDCRAPISSNKNHTLGVKGDKVTLWKGDATQV